MSLYLKKYVGKYSVKAEYDRTTKDFPRGVDGDVDKSFSDLYIPCKSGIKIVHVQRNILMACYMSVGTGHNRLKDIYINNIGSVDKFQTVDDDGKVIKFDFDSMYLELIEGGILTEVFDTDEIIFCFKDENIDKIADVLKPSVNAVDRQPFSKKNLPKVEYDMSSENLDEYRAISTKISKGGLHIMNRLNGAFMLTLVTKRLKLETIKNDMKLKRLKHKEYFHSIGKWNAYIKFLNNYLKES